MIEYDSRYELGSFPRLLKIFVEGGEEKMSVALSVHNTEDLAEIPEEMIRNHIDNIIQFMKDFAQDLSPTPSGTNPREGWPIAGWKTLSEANAEGSNWWNYIEFRDEETRLSVGQII